MKNPEPLKSLYYHFRFKFLAVTSIFFFMSIILTYNGEFENFSKSTQFSLIGPFLLFVGIMFLYLRRKHTLCPYCEKTILTKIDWECPACGKFQNKERFFVDRCLHCREIRQTVFCEHCKNEIRL